MTMCVQVLECHAFICTNEKAANALVRACFHAYADHMYLKMDEQMAKQVPGMAAIKDKHSSTSRSSSPSRSDDNGYVTPLFSSPFPPSSVHTSNSGERGGSGEVPRWSERAITQQTWQRRQQGGEYDAASISSSVAARYKKKSGTQAKDQPKMAGSEIGMMLYYVRRCYFRWCNHAV